MKTNKKILTIFTLCIALLLTACSTTDTADTKENNASLTESDTTSDSSDTVLNDLYQQENQLFADHKEVWDKVFGMMTKGDTDSDENYADYLANTVASNKENFTDDELSTLTKDIETIREIEEQIAKIEKSSSEATDTDSVSDNTATFKNLSGKDFDGNDIDNSLFSKNAVTVMNFWFTGCKPCVAELSKLDELNNAIKTMGGEVIGINTETFDNNKDAIEEAKEILESQGAKYCNLSLDSDSDVGQYAANIMAFPTTILVDRNGNIIGDPLLGGIDQQDNYDALMKQIESVIAADNSGQ